MIKFFRKIRYNLLGQNKTGKYLKYAIGEIVLVMLGILFALQVNNWNEERKESIQEVKILEQLHKEFQDDSINLKAFTKLARKRVKDGKLIKRAITDKNFILENDSIIYKAMKIGRFVFFDSYTPTYSEIVSSGKLSLISSEKVKSLIKIYKLVIESENNYFRNEAQRNKEAYNNHLYKYFEPEILTYFYKLEENTQINNIDLRAFRTDVLGFMSDPKSALQIEILTGIYSETEWINTERTLSRLKRILEALELEIKKFND